MHKELTFSESKLRLVQAFNTFYMFIIIHIRKTVAWVITQEYLSSNEAPCNELCRCNVPPNHRPVCSLISQQCCHPQAGHDSPRNNGTSRLTHSQGCTKHSQANTVAFIRPPKSWRRKIAKLVSSLPSQEHLHQN